MRRREDRTLPEHFRQNIVLELSLCPEIRPSSLIPHIPRRFLKSESLSVTSQTVMSQVTTFSNLRSKRYVLISTASWPDSVPNSSATNCMHSTYTEMKETRFHLQPTLALKFVMILINMLSFPFLTSLLV